MSFHFSITTGAKLTQGQLFAQLLEEERHADYPEEISDATPLADGKNLNVPGKSTRSIHVGGSDSGYDVRVNVMAGRVDWHLAVAAALAVARLTGGTVRLEYGSEEMSADEFRDHCNNDAWIESQVAQGTGAMLSMLKGGKGPITLFGYKGNFTIGMNLLRKLKLENADDKTAYDTLEKFMVAHQRNLLNYTVPSLFTIDAETPGQRDEMIMWWPQRASYLYKTKVVLVCASEEKESEKHLVPFDALIEQAQLSGKLTLTDECNWLAEAFTNEETEALMQRLAPVAINRKKNGAQNDTAWKPTVVPPPQQRSQQQQQPSAKPPVDSPSQQEKKPWWKFWQGGSRL